MDLSSSDFVLDVASGLGETARVLAGEYGCRVCGVDLSKELAAKASNTEKRSQVSYARGDGERLPFKTGAFTVLISECSMCLLPRISSGLDEASRVLQKGGRLGLTDLVVEGPLPVELETVLMSFLCLSNKLSSNHYAQLVKEAGFSSVQISDASDNLRILLKGIKKRLLLAELLSGLGKLSLPPGQIDRGKVLLSLTQEALNNGSLGYFMLTALKSG